MHLPGAAEFAEALDNPAGDFLDTATRIEAQADLPMPDIPVSTLQSSRTSAACTKCAEEPLIHRGGSP